ncbi:ubiquinone/menaquinone biosynthesis C-methyltransferase UbiE [Clostridium tepidiprofundi DSM 19306]|uniref:Ubiquinone/menaquinone biosynthesis C-methyltransferase UbiE n=1 Tax=Clostridium tepidiprofundi DSM 19306 TaxID=1121338 RepID=A0A151B5N4_9CLOT|nr:class I SAM-dependent methyltransferase [Clostridium tepidiprofundi]KYH35110.1 ubiquinone/menaquinone biosynthesis C-methyltransferase UbiE [Clostridium tepidiprofundi DSM 19306]
MDYSKMRDNEILKRQYKDTSKLDIHKTFHEKYSTNKQGFTEWMFEKYMFFNGCRILELGSGKGDLWDGRIEYIGKNSSLVLSDFSDGMITYMQDRYFNQKRVEIMKIDAQNIPFLEETFDIVIANSMLYHVPDLKKAISEIWRVLKKNGVFYAATFGENGFSKYINSTLREMELTTNDIGNISFTLQNGKKTLSTFFPTVKRIDYEDSFEVSNTEDLVDYIYSMASMANLDISHRPNMIAFYDKHRNAESIIKIKKEYGIFIAKKL